MKLERAHNDVKSSGNVGEESNFNIAVNAHMFRVLSDSMYEDKIGSIVRELSCNGQDAHIQAGTPTLPITLHLPNALEPWFAVTDTGIGLSDEDVRSLYTTYGESTKGQSNDMTGAFGLGSKTPFAYSDQFTITSIFQGVRRIYVAVINNEGLPVINQQGEATNVTEHEGLEINIMVRDKDFGEFRDAVLKQLKFFPVKPTLTNNLEQVEFPALDNPDQIAITNDHLTMYTGRFYPVEDIYIVQGGVGYPLNLNHLTDISKSTLSFANALENKGSYLTFDIGQISVTANREGISYDTETIKVIIDRLTSIAVTICDEAMTNIKSEVSVWNRITMYNDQLTVVQQAIKQMPDFDTLFAGSGFDRHGKMIVSIDAIDDLGFNVVYMKEHKYQQRSSYNYVSRVKRFPVPKENTYYDDVVLYPQIDLNIYVRETNKKPVGRIKLFMETNDYPTMIVIESKLKAEVTDKDMKDIAKALRVPVAQLKKLSDLPAPVTVGSPNSNGDVARPKAFQWDNNGTKCSSQEWTRIYDDLDDIGPAYYIEMERHSLRGDWVKLERLLATANAGQLDYPVIAVNGQTCTAIDEGRRGDDLIPWTEANKDIDAKVKGLDTVFNLQARYKEFVRIIEGSFLFKKLSEKGVDIPVLAKVESLKTRLVKLDARLANWKFLRASMQNDIYHAVEEGSALAQKRIDTFIAQYPMLADCDDYYFRDAKVDRAMDYIAQMDELADFVAKV